MRHHVATLLFASLAASAACGPSDSTRADATADAAPDALSDAAPDASLDASADASLDAAPDAPADVPLDLPPVPDGFAPPAPTGIDHVVLIVQENHSFDTYFGSYCTAPAGSNPTCTTGPSCCEAAPTMEPSGASPIALDDTANAHYDPNHSQACELAEINDGAMDRFVHGASCSDARNFAVAPAASVSTYQGYAQRYALADRYFQPIAGATSANDMYLAVARQVFVDNGAVPDTTGAHCVSGATPARYTDQTTVADVLLHAGFSFGVYAEGYASALAAGTGCGRAPTDCPAHLPTYPCLFDPSDIPFQYYAQFADNPTYMHDYAQFAADLARGGLPSFAYIKPIGYHTEHPGLGTRISDGMAFVDRIVQAVLASPYANSTLVLVTWDESGGFFDHVAPPPNSTVDSAPYGPRVPLLALGHFARANAVSHVQLEHASVVRFLEFNFTGATGQLGARDATANNLGSLLDPATTAVAVP